MRKQFALLLVILSLATHNQAIAATITDSVGPGNILQLYGPLTNADVQFYFTPDPGNVYIKPVPSLSSFNFLSGNPALTISGILLNGLGSPGCTGGPGLCSITALISDGPNYVPDTALIGYFNFTITTCTSVFLNCLPRYYTDRLVVREVDVIPLPPALPLPAALPLFATGLGALGLLGWRRKRKAAAALAA